MASRALDSGFPPLSFKKPRTLRLKDSFYAISTFPVIAANFETYLIETDVEEV